MRIFCATLLALAGLCLWPLRVNAQTKVASAAPVHREAWMNTSLDPDTRADLMIHQMTFDEKIQLVHGAGGVGYVLSGVSLPPGHNLGAGYVPGIPRLHLPDINLADSAVGARMGSLESRYSTLLPSVLGMAASWDRSAAYLYGSAVSVIAAPYAPDCSRVGTAFMGIVVCGCGAVAGPEEVTKASLSSDLKSDRVDSIWSDSIIPLEVTIAKYFPSGENLATAPLSSVEGSLN